LNLRFRQRALQCVRVRALTFSRVSQESRQRQGALHVRHEALQPEYAGGAGRPCVLGLATGSTPTEVYRLLVKAHREQGLSFRHVVTFNLDEYVGLKVRAPRSAAFAAPAAPALTGVAAAVARRAAELPEVHAGAPTLALPAAPLAQHAAAVWAGRGLTSALRRRTSLTTWTYCRTTRTFQTAACHLAI